MAIDCVAASAAWHNLEMNPHLYKAAAEGNILPFNEVSEHLHLLVTPIKNTILHIHITSLNPNKSANFVEKILDLCPILLLQVNSKGDTPLHAAAKWGESAIIRVLIEHACRDQHGDLESGVRDVASNEQMLIRMKNNYGDTALHEAARSGAIDVVRMLIREDPDFSYSGNRLGETPLFIAAESGYLDVVTEILETCTSAAHEGPDGITALHAAVLSNNPDITRKILEKRKSLIKERDQNGWTPLHFAAYYGQFSIAQQLLQTDSSVAYVTENEEQMTALHMAASQGYTDIMTEIISHCSDCCEQVDHRGRNVLHFAMNGLSSRAMGKLITNSIFSGLIRNLRQRKDAKGSNPSRVPGAYPRNSSSDIIKDVQAHRMAFSKQNESVPEKLSSGFPKLKQEMSEWSKVVNNGPSQQVDIPSHGKFDIREYCRNTYEQAREVNLVVAALIATVTFAAAFTMPGGYNSEGPEQGMTVLIKNPAFIVFIITDAIAMVCSVFAVYLHLFISLGRHRFKRLLPYALYFIFFAIGAMAIAFFAGIHAVLTPSPKLATAILCIGLGPVILVLILRSKLRI